MVVLRQVAGVNLERERGQRSGQREHRGEQRFGVAASCFEQMAEHREMRVDRVQQPETRNVRCVKFGEALVLLTTRSGEAARTCGEDLYQAAYDGRQIVAGRDIEQRRYVMRVELEEAGGRAPDARDSEDSTALLRFAFEQNAQVLARHLDGL